MNCDFDYKLVNDGQALVIYDLDQGGCSVTNGISEILLTITESVSTLSGKTVIYRDSEGVFDGVALNDDGTFKGFYSINERDLSLALKKAA